MIGWWRRTKTQPTPLPTYAPQPNGEELPETFGITPLVGWRTWRVMMRGPEPYLTGIRQWTWPQAKVQATCLKNPDVHPMHPAPDLNCLCGIYSNLEDHSDEWWSYFWGRPLVYGHVEMWGRIIRCDRGYRAEWARILSPLVLSLTCTIRDDPISYMSKAWCRQPVYALHRAELAGWCEEHQPAITDGLTDPDDWLSWAVPALENRYGVEIRLGGSHG